MASTETTGTRSWTETPPASPALRRWNGELIGRMSWLDKLSGPLQSWISKLYGKPRQPSYRVKDFINGVWFGHPLHPVFVTIPVGAWSAGALLDTIWLLNENEGVARSADITIWFGLAGAGLSAVTGATNWVDTSGSEKRMGMLHALLNGIITSLNLTSAILRITGQRRTAIALSSTAFGFSLYSAYLGGELAYSTGIGVNHVVMEGGSDDFVPTINEQDLVPGKLTRVDVDGIPAVLIKDGDAIYAIAATCSHLGGPLDQGSYEDGIVYCPWHRSGFRMCDGSVANSPAFYAQPSFAVRVRNGKIELRRLQQA